MGYMAVIPEELRQAHEDRKVVFFCGAGVSMPAGLPSFKGLVEQVLESLCPSRGKDPLPWKAFDENRFDEVLDFLERRTRGGYGREVRAKVREILHEKHVGKRFKLDAHVTLCRLAGFEKREGRLVTTNFDSLFDRALKRLRRKAKITHEIPVEIAPALSPPKPSGWHSLVYLHGKLDQDADNTNLVLTTADFGKAYLLDGWARRVVIDLFRHFHVVFIGYSIEDPTMRYLVSALAAAREDKESFNDAYAFAPYGGRDEPKTHEDAVAAWDIKGVIPLAYESSNGHQNLWKELEEWADDHTGGLDSKLQKVTLYGRTRPADTPDEAIRELCWALKDPTVAKRVATLEGDERLNPAWIPTLQENGLLAYPIANDVRVPLASTVLPDRFDLHETSYDLGRWIASSLDSKETLDWAISQGGVLHRVLRILVRNELRHNTNIPTGFRKIWRVLANDEYAHALSVKTMHVSSDYPRLSTDQPGALRDFLNRLRPIPVFSIKPRYSRENGDADVESPTSYWDINIHLLGIEYNQNIDQFRKRATDWEGALISIAEDITGLLKEAMDWQNEFGLASDTEDRTYIELRSISPHDQNKYAKTWTQLIQLSRESFDALAAQDKAGADRLARRWQSLSYPIFRRLALYAATGGGHG